MEQEKQQRILNRIDETLERYETDKQMSVEDSLVAGLHSAVERGWITQQEAEEYLFAYLQSRNLAEQDSSQPQHPSHLPPQEQPTDLIA